MWTPLKPLDKSGGSPDKPSAEPHTEGEGVLPGQKIVTKDQVDTDNHSDGLNKSLEQVHISSSFKMPNEQSGNTTLTQTESRAALLGPSHTQTVMSPASQEDFHLGQHNVRFDMSNTNPPALVPDYNQRDVRSHTSSANNSFSKAYFKLSQTYRNMLKFDGRNQTVHNFLERIEEFSLSHLIDKDQLVNFAHEFFEGDALILFRERRPLKLHEIMEELDNITSEQDLPNTITIFPPDNANGAITDEDSGEEDNDKTYRSQLVTGINHVQLKIK
ncbi:hypothetical protein NQ315_005744 [Exocentrus adspersus]|uniref:Uncharacterized protein n=1 Tax=Exocentrus adspersus TaxID=1586481 RepID=A0AAV8VFF8_9CUCU|nr:hypothetical protein NQ315_005744 [Exocentrus adspersus]